MRVVVPRLRVKDLYEISKELDANKDDRKFTRSSVNFLEFLGIRSFRDPKRNSGSFFVEGSRKYLEIS